MEWITEVERLGMGMGLHQGLGMRMCMRTQMCARADIEVQGWRCEDYLCCFLGVGVGVGGVWGVACGWGRALVVAQAI